MRVTVVTPWYPSDESPTSGIFVQREVLALATHHEVRVIHLDAQPRTAAVQREAHPVPLLRVPFDRRRPNDWRRAVALVRSGSRGSDMVHTHSLTSLTPFAVRRPAGRTPWVHTEHWSGLTAPETLTPVGRASRLVHLPLLGRPDVVVVECRRLGDAVRAHRRGPLRLVPCVVESPTRVVEPVRGEPLRLVGVGGLIPRKGPLIALETLPLLEEAGLTATLTWVGEGPEGAALTRRAQELGIADRLTLTGALDEAGVGRVLDSHDLFVLPTQGDNFCIVTAEALAHGRPVVSGIASGARDYAPPAASRFVSGRSPAAYAAAIRDLVAATAAMPAAQIAATVEDLFTPETVAASYGRIYDEVSASSRSASILGPS